MTRTELVDLVAVCAAVFGVTLYVALIVVPAWSSYSRLWERLAASFLTVYVLIVLIGLGVGAALLAIYIWA